MQSIEQFTAQLVNNPPPGSLVRSHLTLPSTTPTFGPDCSTHLPAWLAMMLRSQGIERLADYQWHALCSAQQGQHVCLSVPTGGGRGVARLLTLYQSLGSSRCGHALCVFPQKHREHSQLKTIMAWNDHLPPERRLTAAIYDGDTPKTARRAIKQSPPNLLLTTPEMVHAGILAYHGGWRAFFQDLRFIVLADLHLCTGALGAHLVHLWRRLRRVSHHYGATPLSFITSAPLGNIHAAAQALSGQHCTVVSGEAWRRQPQTRIMLETPNDTTTTINELAARLSEANLQPLILRRQTAGGGRYQLSPRAAHYAPPSEVVRLGSLQSVIFHGVPSSLACLHDSLAMLASYPTPSISILLLPGQTPLERYLLHHPAMYHAPWLQYLPLDPRNPSVARYHLLCAAAELAPEAGDTTEHQRVATRSQPHRKGHLRSYEPAFTVVHRDNGQFLATMEPEQAFREAFEGAVYQQAGQTFQVERYIAKRRRIVVRPAPASYRTRGIVRARVTDRCIKASLSAEAFRVTYGTLNYTETLSAFERLDARSQTRTSLHTLADMHRQIRTQGVWFDFPDTTTSQCRQTAVHTLVHAVLAGLPLLLVDEGKRITAGISEPGEPGAASPAAVFVDAQAGGNGMSACIYQEHERILRLGLHLLLHCDCARGCNRCVALQRCDACYGPVGLDRRAGIGLLQEMLGEVVPTLEEVRLPGDTAAAESTREQGQAPRYLYLCLTTQKSATDVGGWQHKHLLGLGVAMTYDTRDRRYRAYTAETVEDLLTSLRAADLVIGFNVRDFDYQVLQPYIGAPLAILPTLAILDEVQHALGFRLSLSHLAQETLGIERPDDSIQTLRWFQEGARDRVVEHCQRDITLLRELVHYGLRTGRLFCRDRSGERRAIPVNWQIAEHDG
jgi:DEAD/DEAH box helicase domain-containing protein